MGNVGKLVIVVGPGTPGVIEGLGAMLTEGDILLPGWIIDGRGGGRFCSSGSCLTSMFGHGELGLLTVLDGYG